MLLELIEVIVMAGILFFFCSQIFWPIYRGTAIFPMFHKEPRLWDKLSEERQTTLEKEIEDEIKKEKKGR